MDPGKGEHFGIGEPELLAELRPESAEHIRGDRRLVRDDEDEIAGRSSGMRHEPIIVSQAVTLGDHSSDGLYQRPQLIARDGAQAR